MEAALARNYACAREPWWSDMTCKDTGMRCIGRVVDTVNARHVLRTHESLRARNAMPARILQLHDSFPVDARHTALVFCAEGVETLDAFPRIDDDEFADLVDTMRDLHDACVVMNLDTVPSREWFVRRSGAYVYGCLNMLDTPDDDTLDVFAQADADALDAADAANMCSN